ncbi:MAG: sulfite exporter TauE/SafE family protein [Clostridia bacterium]|nr:sulfite exporter TauE/SafE family protein [Clostridia bacterium]
MSSSLLLTLLAAFLSAILSGLGVGSAGIFVLYLTLVAGYAQPEAQALNLLFFLLSAGAALLLHARERRIPVRVVLFLAVCAVPGAMAGSYLVRVLDAGLLRRLFGGMLVVTGLPQLLKREGRSGRTVGQRTGKGQGKNSAKTR